VTDLHARAAELDDADPLAPCRELFLPAPDVLAYFDGNSLGRPLRSTAERVEEFVRGPWAERLIQGWTDGWLGWPEEVGDALGRVVLGAAPGQVVVADSTTVLLYKLARAAVDAQPDRREVVATDVDFPTDRYVVEGIAAERGMSVRWITADPAGGVTPDQVAAVVGRETALVLLSHVAYRSAWIADAEAITRIAHEAGALVMWDLSHSAGSVVVELDAWDVDLAVGCTYKYLCGGPGAPAFAYVREDLQDRLQQPVWGWIGRRDAFVMGEGYSPAAGIRSWLSGTPPVLAMVPLRAFLDVLEDVGLPAVRAKSQLLTAYAVELADAWLPGVDVVSPREPEQRGGHVALQRTGFRELLGPLWERGVLPDYREPDSLRIGLAPLSTGFAELRDGMAVLRDLAAGGAGPLTARSSGGRRAPS
jgi:kynureninase